MDNNEQRVFEQLKLRERLRLRREFTGIAQRSVVWWIIYFLSLIAMVGGGVLFMIYGISPNRQYWHLLGIVLFHIGLFVLFSMMLTSTSKDRGLLKILGTKNRIISFFVGMILSFIGDILLVIFLLIEPKLLWLFYVAIALAGIGIMIYLLPHALSSKKNIENAKKEDEEFFTWLEKEKNIVRLKKD